jgi:hypothetical protein
MSAVADAAVMLETALKAPTPNTFATYRDMGAPLQPPAVILGPPSLLWEAGCNGPTSARFLLYVVVDASERAAEILWDLVVEVADIIDGTEAVVVQANPASYVTANGDLPCYEMTVECAL